MDLIKFLFRQSKQLFFAAGLFAALSGLCGASLIAVINEGMRGSVASLAPKFFGLCLALLLTRSISQIAMLRMAQDAVLGMRIELSKRLLDTPPQKLQKLGKPALMAILTRDIETFVGALQIAPHILTDGIIVIACFAYLGWLAPSLFGILLATLIVCVVAFGVAQQIPFALLRQMRERLDRVFRHFRDLIEGSRELQLNKQRGHLFVDQVLAADVRALRDLSIKGGTSYTLITNVGDMMFYIVIGVMLFVVPLWLPQDAQTLATVTVLLLYLVGPIGQMMNAVPALGQASVALRKIRQLESDIEAQPLQREVILEPQPGSSTATLVELRDVCHHYHNESGETPFMLGPVNLRIAKGEVLFICGGNGSGKTTLAMLLLGLYQPESGGVFLHGQSVHEGNVDDYRNHFAAVFADFHLMEYVLGIDPAAITAQADDYLKKLRLDRKVRLADGKFSTIELSSGQKKRLALLTAYLDDKPIYLFDEWAADQDPAFKKVFYQTLLPELKAKGKTVIVISHDDAYFGCADRIVELSEGHIRADRRQHRDYAAAAA
ncbi:cyclic peptide export ABC transporter [Paucibacter sp. APW11]|uniref:Cyclic peptide export ABC transporter n=1 Tax=Roseateles aquae TaxID=3077235 RepID=A0ABU3PEV5_9BURK|nr:cyclic peptide export ABC transporter [Paucibacter sp. APW11]MDT9001114.1 cyclic peptide export ABC transporter [Paucibacter sp. APW11]